MARAGRPRSRAAARPGASGRLERTRAMSQPVSWPVRMLSAMRRKLEPRPESRMPSLAGCRDMGGGVSAGLQPAVLLWAFPGASPQAITARAFSAFWSGQSASLHSR